MARWEHHPLQTLDGKPGARSGIQEIDQMNRFILAFAIAGLTVGAAQAQSMNKDDGGGKGPAPGATGALGNVNANGVATDPGGVKAQQGDTSKSSPGTVGAAPGADTKSQKPK
jgi:hypothetical protein